MSDIKEDHSVVFDDESNGGENKHTTDLFDDECVEVYNVISDDVRGLLADIDWVNE